MHTSEEAIRDGHIEVNPIENVECLNKAPDKPRDALTDKEIALLYPTDYEEALKIWESHFNFTIMTLLVTTGMRSGELRALNWKDVIWEDSGILITKSMKDIGGIGSAKEKREKFVRIPHKTLSLLKLLVILTSDVCTLSMVDIQINHYTDLIKRHL